MTDIYAVLGRYDLENSAEAHWIKKDIVKEYISPDFLTTKQLSNGDVALLKLSQPVTFTDYIQPICMPKASDDVINKVGVIVGYGRVDMGHTSDYRLKSAHISSINPWKCLGIDKYYWKIVSERSFCAGTQATIPCKGE